MVLPIEEEEGVVTRSFLVVGAKSPDLWRGFSRRLEELSSKWSRHLKVHFYQKDPTGGNALDLSLRDEKQAYELHATIVV